VTVSADDDCRISLRETTVDVLHVSGCGRVDV
jgi:hypothetical protein